MGRDVVRKGRALAVGGNRLETVAPVPGNLRPKGAQLARCIPFIHRTASLDGLFKPIKEALHRQAVFDMDVAHTFDLGSILDGLAQSDGRIPLDHGALYGIGLEDMVKVVVQGRGIDGKVPYGTVFNLAGKYDGNVVIRKDGNAFIPQLLE